MSIITCYGYSGLAYPDNYQCPGNDACCGNVTFCTPQRLCLKDDGQLVRSPCKNNPYTNDTCAEICLYGYLPRVTICTDGSYCCDNDPNCCADGTGVFLNDIGEVIQSESPTSTSTTATGSSTTTSASTTSTSAATTTTSSAATSSAASNSSSGLSAGAAAGIGVGAALGVILAALVSFYLYRRRKSKRSAQPTEKPQVYSGPPEMGSDYTASAYPNYQPMVPLQYTDGTSPPPPTNVQAHEMAASQKTPRYEMEAQ